MPIRDVAAQNASLNNDYGATKGPNAAPSHLVALFAGDPGNGGVEIADTTEVDDGAGGTTFVANGYARASITNDGTTWAAAADGLKSTNAPVQFPAALAEYPATITHAALFAPDGVTMWDYSPTADPIDVTAAGNGPAVALTVFYADSITEE